MIACDKEADGSKVAKQVLNVAILEDALQRQGSGAGMERLNLQGVVARNVEPRTGHVGAGLLGVEESQQHAAWLHERPEAGDRGLDQALFHVVGEIPAQHEIEGDSRVGQIFGEEVLAIDCGLGGQAQGGIGGGAQEVLRVDAMAALGKVVDVQARGGTEVEDGEGGIGGAIAGDLSQTTGVASQ